MKKKCSSKSRGNPLWIIISIFVGLLAVILATQAVSSKRKKLQTTRKIQPLSTTLAPSTWTLSEMHTFWESELETLFIRTLPSGRYWIPEIQELYNAHVGEIRTRYGTNLTFGLLTGYLPEHRDILIGCWVKNGAPMIDVVVPAFMDVFESEKRQGASPQRLEFIALIGLMHELDHLVGGYVSGSRANPAELPKLVEHEKNAWALTTENTIRILVEKYAAPLGQSDLLFYSEWIKSGQNVESLQWEEFIRGMYRKTR